MKIGDETDTGPSHLTPTQAALAVAVAIGLTIACGVLAALIY